MGKHVLQITVNPLRQFFLFFLHPFLSALSCLAFNLLPALSVFSVVKSLHPPTNPLSPAFELFLTRFAKRPHPRTLSTSYHDVIFVAAFL